MGNMGKYQAELDNCERTVAEATDTTHKQILNRIAEQWRIILRSRLWTGRANSCLARAAAARSSLAADASALFLRITCKGGTAIQ